MEIAFFLTGITKTASDQSISIGAASGSFATALAMSSSVIASKRAQSVLPLRRSPHFLVTIFSFFIFPRAPRRDDPDECATVRSGDRDLPLLDVPKDFVATDFTSFAKRIYVCNALIEAHQRSFRGVSKTRTRNLEIPGPRCACPGMTAAPVNSREKVNNLRILADAAYIHDRLAAAPDSHKIPYALYASIPRRAACPASGFGSRGPAREVEAGRARVERLVAVSTGEVAVVHGQRPEGFLPRLLVRQAWRHHLLPDGDRRRRLRRSRRAAGADGGRAAACRHTRCRASRAAAQDAVRRDGSCREILRRHLGLAPWRQGARLSRRPRDFAGRPVAVSHRLRARRTLRTERTFGRPGHFRDRKSTRLNSSHTVISYAVFCL